MNKRKAFILAGLFILVLGFGGMKYLQSLRKPPARIDAMGTYPSVQTLLVKNTEIPHRFNFTGRVISRNKVELFAEVTGLVMPSAKEFKEGSFFNNGEILLRIDSLEYYHNLQSARSAFLNLVLQAVADIKFDFPNEYEKWNNYSISIDLNSALPELPKTDSKLRNFIASRDVYNRYYAIRSQENRLSKYNIRAPFNGSLMDGFMPVGSMVRQGQKLGTFIKSGEVEIELTLDNYSAEIVQTGDSVVLRSGDALKTYSGRIVRKSQHVDASTQSYKIFVGATHPDLKEGQYLSGEIYSRQIQIGILMNRSLVMPGDLVYTVQDSLLVPMSVEIFPFSDNRVIANGLPDGSRILNQNLSTSYKGMKVSPIL